MLDIPDWLSGSDPNLKEAERLLQAEQYADAAALFSKAVARTSQRPRRARALLGLAQCEFKQKKIAEAQKTAESAYELLGKKSSIELAACAELLGEITERNGDLEKARNYFREALTAQEKIRPMQAALLTKRQRRLAKALSREESAEARKLFEQAVTTAEKRLGTHSAGAADCLLDFGEFQITHDEQEAGVASMQRALDIYRDANSDSCEEVARGLQRLAAACQKAGDLEKAVLYYEKALHARERQVGGNVADLGVLLVGFADVQMQMGNDAPANQMLQQAVGKLEGSGHDDLGWALENLGLTYGRLGRMDEAVSCYKRARGVWEKAPDSNQQYLLVNTEHLHEALRLSGRSAEFTSIVAVASPAVDSAPAIDTAADPAASPQKKVRVKDFYGSTPSNAPVADDPSFEGVVLKSSGPEGPPPAPFPSPFPPPFMQPGQPGARPVHGPPGELQPFTAVPIFGGPGPGNAGAGRPAAPMNIVPIHKLLPVNLEMRAPLQQAERPAGSAYIGQGSNEGIPALVHLSGLNTGQAAGRLLADPHLHLTVVSSGASPHTPAAPAGPKPVFSAPARTELSGWEDIDFELVTP